MSQSKRCQSCGSGFQCGLSCCWCDAIALDANVRAALQARFSDCLCPRCLEHAIADARPPRRDDETATGGRT
jgi:hypothetical protein